jgi:hypothetical protein
MNIIQHTANTPFVLPIKNQGKLLVVLASNQTYSVGSRFHIYENANAFKVAQKSDE